MKKNIAVIFGGKSAEHEVSIITAHHPIIKALEATGDFDVWPVYISKNGQWYADKAMNDINFFKPANFSSNISKLKQINLSLNDGLTLIWPGLKTKTVKIDLAFPAMHGTYGEDGSLMGLLRLANIPFVGCDLFASAVAMDKVLTKQVVSTEDIPVVPYVWFTKYDWAKNEKEILKNISKLSMPLFVKPVHLGSSIAITRVKTKGELVNAIEVALHYDDKVLVEEGVNNLIEVTLPMKGNDEVELAGIERPLNNTDFFDFNDKYLSKGKKGGEGLNENYSEIPAKIEKSLAEKVADYGKRTYRVLGCTGTARVDFLINEKTKEVFVNEVNTLPGGLYDHNWRKMGVSNVELVTSLVKMAEEKFAENGKATYTFESDILNKIGGSKFSE